METFILLEEQCIQAVKWCLINLIFLHFLHLNTKRMAKTQLKVDIFELPLAVVGYSRRQIIL